MSNMRINIRLIIKWMALIVAGMATSTCSIVMAEPGSAQFTAIFAFGDSLTDPGNNNYLNSLAKANYVPYGIDYVGPSGRFCNGKTAIDYLGDLVGIPAPPPYTSSLFANEKDILLRGVNYASAAGGILKETGRNLGERFSLSQQIENFENTLNELRNEMEKEDLSNHLAKALVVMALGSNDYANNYLMPSFYATSDVYSPKEYADLLINRYSTHILTLHNLGLRKFMMGGIGPLGCIPNQLAKGRMPPGKCVAFTNDIVEMFNIRLIALVDELNLKYRNESMSSYGNTFGAFIDILTNATNYGFSVVDKGCCGIGRNRGQITCLPFSVPCIDREEYVFWDAFHPTQAVNQILAQRAYSGTPSDCHPMNVHQMAHL